MAKVSNKKDIIKEIKKYELVLDNTYTKDNETFLLICDAVTVNEMCFRDVRSVHFIGNTMWIDNASIETGDVHKFHISNTGVKYEQKSLQIKGKQRKDFKIK